MRKSRRRAPLPVIEPGHEVRNAGRCLDPCPGSALCAMCAEEVRMEAFHWLRDLAKGTEGEERLVLVLDSATRWAARGASAPS
jgi:hypothetical protein